MAYRGQRLDEVPIKARRKCVVPLGQRGNLGSQQTRTASILLSAVSPRQLLLPSCGQLRRCVRCSPLLGGVSDTGNTKNLGCASALVPSGTRVTKRVCTLGEFHAEGSNSSLRLSAKHSAA